MKEEKKDTKVTQYYVCLPVGLKDIEDIKEDLDQALCASQS